VWLTRGRGVAASDPQTNWRADGRASAPNDRIAGKRPPGGSRDTRGYAAPARLALSFFRNDGGSMTERKIEADETPRPLTRGEWLAFLAAESQVKFQVHVVWAVGIFISF